MKIVGKIEDLLKKAVAHHRNDEWGEVERLYHRVLQNDSMHPDALHLSVEYGCGSPGWGHS